MKNKTYELKYENVIKDFPKIRDDLPKEYQEIWDEHYLDSRNGRTKVTKAASIMERWLHKKVASTSSIKRTTLEIGAGTLNQLEYETECEYDIVEPQHMLYKNSKYISRVRCFYDDIEFVEGREIYDRIISIATFEHITNLPEVIKRCSVLLKKDGILGVSIPNEGRFLWHFAYTMTTGMEFKRKYGLDYEIWMKYEHVNTADEIETILKHYFMNVKPKFMGIGKSFSFYRYYECTQPIKR